MTSPFSSSSERRHKCASSMLWHVEGNLIKVMSEKERKNGGISFLPFANSVSIYSGFLLPSFRFGSLHRSALTGLSPDFSADVNLRSLWRECIFALRRQFSFVDHSKRCCITIVLPLFLFPQVLGSSWNKFILSLKEKYIYTYIVCTLKIMVIRFSSSRKIYKVW